MEFHSHSICIHHHSLALLLLLLSLNCLSLRPVPLPLPMDSWVVAPVARWLQRQDPSVLATNGDVAVSPPELKEDEQQGPAGKPSTDTSTQAESSQHLVLDSASVNNPLDTQQQPPQNEQQQPFAVITTQVSSAFPTTAVGATSPPAEDKTNGSSAWMPASPSRVANAIKGLFDTSSPERLQPVRSFADSDPTFSLDQHHGPVADDTATRIKANTGQTQQPQYQPQQLQILQPIQQPSQEPISPVYDTSAVATTTVITEQPRPMQENLAPHLDDPYPLGPLTPNNTSNHRKMNLQTIVRAIQWLVSGTKVPDSPTTSEGNSQDSVQTSGEEDESPKNTPRSERSSKRKKNRYRRKLAPDIPPPRPTISRTRLKVFVGTWNMMGRMPDIQEGLTGFLDLQNLQEQQNQQQQKQQPPHQQQQEPHLPQHQPHHYHQNAPGTGALPPTLGHSLSTPNLVTPSLVEPSSASPNNGAHTNVHGSQPSPKGKSRKRRASDLLKKLRHPSRKASPAVNGIASESSHTRSKEREYSSSPALMTPGILQQPFLEMNAKAPYHIIAINTQECEREIREAVLFPSKSTWEKHLQTALGPDYVMIKTETMAALHIAVFIWKPIEDLVSAVDSSAVATGIGGIVGNKGAVAVSVYLGSMSFLFVNAHLTANQGNTVARNNDYKRIIHELQVNDAPKTNPRGWHFKGDMKLRRHYDHPPVLLPQKPFQKDNHSSGTLHPTSSNNSNGIQGGNPQRLTSPASDLVASEQSGSNHGGGKQGQQEEHHGDSSSQAHATAAAVDITDQFDYTFWAGDLNYRVDLPRAEADECIARDDLQTLMAHDQLSAQRAAGAVFDGFMEAPIAFKPTYKFDPLIPISERRLRRRRQKSLGRPMSMINIYGSLTGTLSPLMVPESDGGSGRHASLYSAEGNKSCPTLMLEANMGDVGPVVWRLPRSPAPSVPKTDRSDPAESMTTTDSSDQEPAFANLLEDSNTRNAHRGLSMSRAIASVRRRRHTIMDTISPKPHALDQGQQQDHTRRHSGDLLIQVLDPNGKATDGFVRDGDEELAVVTGLESELYPAFVHDEKDLEKQRAFYGVNTITASPKESSPSSKSPFNLDAPLPPLPSPNPSQSPAPSSSETTDGSQDSPLTNRITSDEGFSVEQARELEKQRLLKLVRYDTSSKQRVPSWTDRILWKSTGGNFYLPAEIGDDTRSGSPLSSPRFGGGVGVKGWSLLRKNRTRPASGDGGGGGGGTGPPRAVRPPTPELQRETLQSIPGSFNSDSRVFWPFRTNNDNQKLVQLSTTNGHADDFQTRSSRQHSTGGSSHRPSLLDSFKFDFSSKKRHQHHGQSNDPGTTTSSSTTARRNLLSVEDEDRAAVIVKEYTAHHETGLFSDHRPVTAVFAVRFDWNMTDRGVIGSSGGPLEAMLQEGRHHGAAADGANRWGPLDKVLEKMGK